MLAAASWVALVTGVPIACFTGAPASPDAGPDGEAGCGSFFCLDATPSVDPFGDAALALRMRSLAGSVSCQGQPEQSCHSSLQGNTNLAIDLDAAAYSIFGLINVPSSELPDVLRVEPFHPETSYLYWKVTGDPRILDGSLIMPASSGVVDPRIVALVGPWIEAGAP